MNTPKNLVFLLQERRAAFLLTKPRYVLVTAEIEFERFQADFAEFCRLNPNTLLLLKLGFEHETPEPAAHLGKLVTDFKASFDDKGEIIVLCNDNNECQAIHAHGAETFLANSNIFLDERRYQPFYGERPFDAVYLARLTPFKRHTLIPIELAPKLLFLGAGVRSNEMEYANKVHSLYATSTWIPSFKGAMISEYLAKAKCGLALSAIEGQCYASSEYFLCGLPVVDTPALGGRALLYPDEFVKEVQDTPEAIAAGIAFWTAHPQKPDKVRKAWLDKVKPYRDSFRQLMYELTGKSFFPQHKLGIRTPHPGKAYSFAIQFYMSIRSLFSKL